MEQSIYLVLEDGSVLEGKSFGAEGEVTGEVVFTTGMVGYLETLTDPSYYGQIVVQTFPLIGNYGVSPGEFEGGKPALSAYLVREWCEEPSNFRCEGTLDEDLKKAGVIGLYGIDTRALTRIIREELEAVREKYGDERRTEIAAVSGEVDIEDLIPEEECVITLTHFGYVKRQAVDVYKSQKRGGRGIQGMTHR